MHFTISPKQVLRTLVGFILMLILLSSISNFLRLSLDNDFAKSVQRLLNVDYEDNIPTIYSGLALFVSSVLLFLIALQSNKLNKQFWPWVFLGILFLFLGFDEITQVHEKLIRSLRYRWNLTGYLYSGWVIPYGIAAFGILLAYFKFLLRLPTKTRNYIVVSGLIFIFGSVILEMISVDIGFAHERNDISAAYFIVMTFEEFLEMLGIALFIYTLLDYMSNTYGSLEIKISNQKES